MRNMTRRELLAWIAAGGATGIAGWSLRPDTDPRPGPASPTGSAPAMRGDGTPATAPVTVGAAGRNDRSTGGAGPRVLVVVEMAGGNDSLSMVVPYGDGEYYSARPTLAIAPDEVISIDDRFGFHPALQRVAALSPAIVHGIGTSQPDGSHFEMMKRWWRGSADALGVSTGWAGRVADLIGDREALATAVTIGSGAHPILQSRQAATLAVPNADAAWYLAGADDPVAEAFQAGVRSFGAGSSSLPDGPARALAEMAGRTALLADQLIAGDAASLVEYPGSELGRSLSFARQLVSLEAGVRVVHVVFDDDFDTHEGHSWRYPELLATFDAAIGAFFDDLDAHALTDRVLVMTTSEFGRTLFENGSDGLDHGTAASALLLGPVDPVQLGEFPSLSTLDDNRDVVATVEFEAYLGGVVEHWLGLPSGELFGSTPIPIPVTKGV